MTSASSARTGYALIAGAAVSWGTWSLLLRPAEARGPIDSALECLIVVSFIAVAVLPFAIRDTRNRTGPKRPFWPLLLLGVSDALNILLFFRAMRAGSLAIAVLTHATAPILVTALAPLITGERARLRTWVAILVASLGLVLLLEPWQEPATGAIAAASFGFASAIFYATNVLAQKRLGPLFSPAEVLSYHSFPQAMLLALMVPSGGFHLRLDQTPYLALGGLIPGVFAGIAFLRGLSLVPASHAALIALLEPTVAVLVGIVVWHEPLRPLAMVGAALVVAALLTTTLELPRPTRSSAAL